MSQAGSTEWPMDGADGLSPEQQLLLLLVIAGGGFAHEDDVIWQAVEWELANGPPDPGKLKAFAASIPAHKWELARAKAARQKEGE